MGLISTNIMQQPPILDITICESNPIIGGGKLYLTLGHHQ